MHLCGTAPNNRLEIAISEAVADAEATSHFKTFLESIYPLFSQSSKNQRELSEVSSDIGRQFLTIGRGLDVRWVSSSFRTVLFVSLSQH